MRSITQMDESYQLWVVSYNDCSSRLLTDRTQFDSETTHHLCPISPKTEASPRRRSRKLVRPTAWQTKCRKKGVGIESNIGYHFKVSVETGIRKSQSRRNATKVCCLLPAGRDNRGIGSPDFYFLKENIG